MTEWWQYPALRPGLSHVVTLPTELGRVTGLRAEGDAIVATTESGVDYILPANKLHNPEAVQ